MTPLALLLEFLQKNMNGIIIVSGVVMLLILLWNGAQLSGKRSRIEEALCHKKSNYFKDAVKRELAEKEDRHSSVDPNKIRALEAEFNSTCSLHGVLVQLIPIFPLLGILGTVAGLMMEVGNIKAMQESLNTALNSTFWGLISAIVLKFVEAVFPSRVINSVEIMLDDFDKKMNIAEMFRDSENKE